MTDPNDPFDFQREAYNTGIKAARDIVATSRIVTKKWREKYHKEGDMTLSGKFSFTEMRLEEILAQIDSLLPKE
jgi:hypothetical protein